MLIQDTPNSPVSTEAKSIAKWAADSQNWAYAYGRPDIELGFKQLPQDFQVREALPLIPSCEGEHWWLYVKKVRCHTADVSKALARFAKVSYRDVGYSGLKDYFAETYQWFSIYRPKATPIDWRGFDLVGVEILEIFKHNKKLRRSTHSGNKFQIVLRSDGIAENIQMRCDLECRLKAIKNEGVPNYFGLQRFGLGMSNIEKALEFFSQTNTAPKRFNDRQAMWVSAARAWLFNTVLAERVKQGSWNTLQLGEPCNLNSTQSYFLSTEDDDLEQRLALGDIHPTAPLWGRFSARDKELLGSIALHLKAEKACLSELDVFTSGLERMGLAYRRRSTRCLPQRLDWHFEENRLVLKFELLSGQYATSVLRELIQF